MAQERAATRLSAVVERRPPAAATPARSTAAAVASPASALRQRLGNQGTHALFTGGAVPFGGSITAGIGAPAAAPVRTPVPGEPSAPLPQAPVAPAPERSRAASPSQQAAAPAAVPVEAPAPEKPAAAAAAAPAAKAAAETQPQAPPGAAVAAEEPAAPPAPPSPREAVAPAISAVRQRAAGARKHSPPAKPVGSAQAAAIEPRREQTRTAAAQTVANLDAAEAEAVKREAFKDKLKKAIDDATPKPKTESEAENVMSQGAGRASNTLRGELATERDAAAGPMKTASQTEVPPSAQPAPPKTELQPEPLGAPPAPVSAAPVVPAPLPPERLDYSSDRGPTERVMAENNVTQEQLKKGNDPEFGPAIEARSSAENHEAAAESRYRQSEANVQDEARGSARAALAGDLAGMHGARGLHVGGVIAKQVGTSAKNAAERQRVTDSINGIKDAARKDVEALLGTMETEAANIFEAGLKRAEDAYRDTFEEEKGGIGTWLTTWGSDWEELIEKSLAKARVEYLRQVDIAIDQVADLVDGKLNAAKQRVAEGRKQVETFVSGLDENVRGFGEEALQAVSAEFDAMSADIDQRGDALVGKLVQQYKASYERMSAMEEKLREENKSLWQRVYDATVGLIKKIIAFKDMLVGILRKAASLIVDIISDPIGFLGNLIDGVMTGLKNFMSNIGAHLKKGLMDWLFGALAGAGLQLPDTFDLKGILSIVLQILGLTYANFRARAVAIVGEPVVAGLEQAAEVFKVFVTEGVGGLWRFIKEKVADLKSMVLDAIFDFIKEKVIIAGVTWIIGLLNPASAFFKACKAIYDIVMFFVNRGSQIIALVNAVIDSIASIVKGNIAAAANLVENALAKAVPVAIGFLAGLLGLGDPSKPVRQTIEKAQAPVNKAIDWVIHQAVKLVKAAGKLIDRVLGKKEKGEQKGAKGEQGHIGIAQEVGAKLLEAELPSEGIQAAMTMMRQRAGALEAQYGRRLEPGVKLRVVFNEPRDGSVDRDIDFKVVIAPNTTEVDFVKQYEEGYPAPVVGPYSTMDRVRQTDKLPDKATRAAHHAPPVQFALTLGSLLAQAGLELYSSAKDADQRKAAAVLQSAGKELTQTGENHGPSLPAILVHPTTHLEKGEDLSRMHGREVRNALDALLVEKGVAKDVARTKSGDVALQLFGSTITRQVTTVARSETKDETVSESNVTQALQTRGPAIIARVYAAEETRSVGAVQIALQGSKKDGPPEKRQSAISQLRTLCATTWKVLINAVKF
jgi:hypothetical protein